MRPLSNAVLSVPPSGIRRFFDLVSEMDDVISLGVGEPDFVTPWPVRAAAIKSLEDGYTTYTSNYGLLELRREIAHMLAGRYHVSYEPAGEILVTVGVSEGLDIAFRALLNPGDEVLIPEPCYVSYVPCARFAGGCPIAVPTRAEDGFRVRPADVAARITPRTKAILLSFPSNPTGATMPEADLRAIVDLAARHDLYLLSDEIYDRLSYDGPHTCVASLPGARERTVLLNGFSKAYAMTGWRIGYVCAPAAIVEAMMKIHQYTIMCAPITAQKAAIEALRHGDPDVDAMVADYERRRRLFVGGLNDLGLTCHLPGGAFYAFPNVTERSGLSAEVFAERLLLEQRVLVVPGPVFGAGGTGHVRCCYATATDKLREALVRIGKFLNTL